MIETPDKQAADTAELLERQAKQAPDPFPRADLADFDSADLYGGRLLIQRWTPEQESEGGIVLVEANKEAPAAGWVLKIGDDVPAGKFCVGDTVLFGSYAIQALPDVTGTPASGEVWTKYNYLNHQDTVLRYPLHLTLIDERTAKIRANQANRVVQSMGMEAPE